MNEEKEIGMFKSFIGIVLRRALLALRRYFDPFYAYRFKTSTHYATLEAESLSGYEVCIDIHTCTYDVLDIDGQVDKEYSIFQVSSSISGQAPEALKEASSLVLKFPVPERLFLDPSIVAKHLSERYLQILHNHMREAHLLY